MKKPAFACRLTAGFLGFVLVCLILVSAGWSLGQELAFGNSIYSRTYAAFEDAQLQELHALAGELAGRYGFSADSVCGLLTRDSLRESSGRVVEWLHALFAEEPDTDVPVVYFAGIEDIVRDDAGFLSTVPENLQRSTARNDVENVLIRRGQSMIFPIRGQLLLAARMEAEKKLDLERIVQWLQKFYLIYVCMGVILLAIVLLMMKNEYYALGYVGAALAASAVVLLLIWVFAYLLNIPGAVMIANAYASRWAGRFLVEVLLYLLRWIVPCLVAGGAFMALAGHGRKGRA